MIGSFVVALTYLLRFDEMIGNFTFPPFEETFSPSRSSSAVMCSGVVGRGGGGARRPLFTSPGAGLLGAAARPVSTFLWTFFLH